MRIVFILVCFIMTVWKIKKGFQNGILKEVINVLSAVVACVSIALLFLAISSVVTKSFSALTVCISGLIGVGIVYRICKLIFKPITGIFHISIINGLNKLLGAIIGLVEAVVYSWLLYLILDSLGFYIL
ncbi:MAG: CvpA family protein [Lachnospiraceae bacterium]|nr:CvpA family protein [Lachnospiraceae bacterium]